MAKYTVKGMLELGTGQSRSFEREFDAASEKRARDAAFCFFGSKSGLRRACVKIEAVSKSA